MRIGVVLLLALAGIAISGAAFAADGEGVYEEHCATCHGDKGEGLKKLGPPIVGNSFIMGSDLVAIVKMMRDGRVDETKLFKDYPLPMVPQKMLSDEELEAVAAFIKVMAAGR